MGSAISKFINKQPTRIKKISYKLIPFKYRYGKKYIEFLNFLKKSKKWSYDQSLDYQFNKLKNLLIYCNQSVPYYQELFKSIGFNPKIKKIDDIKVLPFLDKETIISNYEKLIANNFYGKKYKMNTSGSTGKRLSIYGSDDLFKIESAFITNAYEDHGAKLYTDHSIWIRRYSPQKDEPIFFEDNELNRTYMSPFHLNDDTIFSYVDFINKRKSKILVSYPSTIYYLGILCQKYDLKLKYVKYIHGASELCLPQWEEKIKECLGIPIKMHYGQVEKVSFAHQDSNDNFYKENLLYGYNEYINNEIIGTGFYNYVMPLIRYKTNDIVDLIDVPKLNGSEPKTIKKILGRNGDMLITEKNSYVPAVNFYSFMSKYEDIDMFQITQNKENKNIDFLIVPNYNFNLETEEKLYDEMYYRLGNININIIKVDNLKRDENTSKIKTIRLI